MERSVAMATSTSRMYGILRPQNIEENQDVTGEIHYINNSLAFFTYNVWIPLWSFRQKRLERNLLYSVSMHQI